nr:GxxExxY protein [Syntrophothermus lipocalidus]
MLRFIRRRRTQIFGHRWTLISTDLHRCLMVNNSVVGEAKATENMDQVFEARLLEYFKATGIRLELLVNLGPKVTVEPRAL